MPGCSQRVLGVLCVISAQSAEGISQAHYFGMCKCSILDILRWNFDGGFSKFYRSVTIQSIWHGSFYLTSDPNFVYKEH